MKLKVNSNDFLRHALFRQFFFFFVFLNVGISLNGNLRIVARNVNFFEENLYDCFWNVISFTYHINTSILM